MGDAVVAHAPVAAALRGCAFRSDFSYPHVLGTARSWDACMANLHLHDAVAGMQIETCVIHSPWESLQVRSLRTETESV